MKYLVNSLRFLFLLITASAICTPVAHASQLDYWSVDGDQRIFQTSNSSNPFMDENGVPLKNSPLNITWKNGEVVLTGAKNSYATFQVIAENNTNNSISNVSLKLESLTGPGGTEIKNTNNSDAYNYVGKHIYAYRAHYMNITSPLPWESHPERTVDFMLGMVPDPLIPNTNAVNTTPIFSIASRKNQSAYFEIYIPKNIPAGEYRGSIISKIGSINDVSIPVKLLVHSFTLDDKSPIDNMFYISFNDVGAKLGVPANNDIIKRYFFSAHRHNMDLVANANPTNFKNTYQQFVNGTKYSVDNGYYGVGINTPHTMYSIGTYDLTHADNNSSSGIQSGFNPENSATYKRVAEEWMQIFETDPKLANTQYFKFMIDEPDNLPNSIARINKLAEWIHAGNYQGKKLKTYCTANFTVPDSSCDMFSLTAFWTGHLTPEAIASRVAKGNIVGFYGGSKPWLGQGFEQASRYLTDARMYPWIFAKIPNLDFYFYWETTYRYVNPITYGGIPIRNYSGNTGAPNAHANSEAKVIYPSIDKDFPEDTIAFGLPPGPIDSMRMKSWRSGTQDLKYLNLAKSQISANYAKEQAEKVIPKVLYEVPNHTQVLPNPNYPSSWSDYGYSFEAQRRTISTALDTNQTTPLPTPTPIPSGNLLQNGDFSEGANFWNAGLGGTIVVDQGAAKYTLTNSNEFNQLLQQGISLSSGETYRVSFKARSSVSSIISIELLKDVAPNTNYVTSGNLSGVNLTPEWKTFETTFTAGNFVGSVNDARFRFVLNGAANDTAFWFDDVVVHNTADQAWDLNNNGKVDIFDWSYFVKSFGGSFGVSDVVKFVGAFGR